jgi:gliding motility-associated-like protein
MKKILFFLIVLGLPLTTKGLDVGVTAITNPVSGCNLSSPQPVTITIRNFALVALNATLTLTYSINGVNQATETATISAGASGTATYTFAKLWTGFGYGTFTFDACATEATDFTPGNNCFTQNNGGTPLTVINYAPSVGGTITSNATVCSGSNGPTMLTLAGYTGTINDWEYSTNSGGTWTGLGLPANTTTYTYTNLTTTTWYRARVTNGVCGPAYSAITVITVDPVSVGGIITSDASVCSGSNGATLTLGGYTGAITKWQYSTNGGGLWTDIVNTTITQNYLNLTTTTMYRAVITSGVCAPANSAPVTITVSPVTVGGTVTSDATVCSGSNSGILTLAGHTGTILNWEYSTDGGSSWTTVSNTTTSQNYTNLTTTTRYRAQVKSGVCSIVPSIPAIITVDPATVGGIISSNAIVCSGSNSGTLTLSGYTGAIQKWQFSTDGGGSWTDIANTTIAESYTNLTATTIYRAVLKSGVCATANSGTATITVNPASVGGSVTSSTTVCSGSNAGALTLAGNIGSVIRWEYSSDGTLWAPISNTTTTQNYLNLTSTLMYRAVVQSGVCPSANAAAATITVDPVSVGGTVSSNATVCSGTNSGTLNLAGNIGAVQKWQFSTDGGGSWTDIVNVTSSQAYTNLTTTTMYRAVIKSGVCSSVNSAAATITVDPVSVGGTVNSSATVCSGSNSGTLILTGNTGNVIRWEYSTDGVLWATIPNTATNQNYLNLTVSTWYRAVVQSGVCALANATAALITIDPVSVGGSVSSNATVCSGTNSGTLTLSGNIGTVQKWQFSTDGGGSWTDVANVTSTLNYTNLTATTLYRAVVKSGVCSSANSASVTITVDPVSVGGILSSNATVCSGSNSGTLSLSGNTGSVQKWEFSTDGGTSWTDIVNTSSTQNYFNITSTTIYRAVIKSGVCSVANSSTATITVDPVSVGGSVNSSATVCSGSNSGTLLLSGQTGNIIRWENSTNSGGTWNTIANVTGSQAYTNITSTTWYRALVQSGVCASAYSGIAVLTVDPVSVGGTLSSNATVCSGSNSGTINLNGHTGNVTKWQFSTDGGGSWTDIANTTTSQNYLNLTSTTIYRAVVQSGVCSSANSTTVTITVSPVSVGGSVTSNATVCSGSNSGTLTLAGNTGTVTRWEYSTDGILWAPIFNTALTQSYLNLTSTTLFRAVVQSGVCSSANSAAATITVDPVSVGGTISSNATVCSGTNSGTLTLSGNTGAVQKWQFSTNGGSSWTDIANVTSSQIYTNLTTTTIYRAEVKSGTCSSTNSSSATITVDPVTVGGSVTSNATVCSGSNSGTVNLSGNTGAVQKWQYSTDAGTSWTDIVNSTVSQGYNNLTATTMYRAVVQSGVCSSANSSAATITVDPATVGGSVSSNATVCSGSNSATLILSGHTGSVLRWESTTNNGGTWTSIANTTTSQIYTNITSTTWYRAVVQSGLCTSATSGIAVITVDPLSVGGTVSSNATVCSGSNNGTLTLSSYTGSIQKWQFSTDGGGSWTDIANTTNVETFTNLTATTLYRAVVQSGVCSVVNSSAATITVNPISAGGAVTSDATVCSGSNGAVLTLAGHSGSVIRWEYSTDGVLWGPISNTTTTQNYLNLSTTSLFRAVVQSGVCPAVNSTPATITVDPVSVGGSVSSNTTVCSGINSGTVTLTGNTGSVQKWQFSTDGGTSWTDIANVTSSETYTNLTVTTLYRAVVKSGTCSSANSTAATITVDPVSVGGAVNSSATVCSGSNSGILVLSGETGNVTRWEYSTDGGTVWNILPNTSTTYNYNNLTTSTMYRAVVKSGVCSSSTSASATITVDPATVAGSVSSNATECSGSNSGTLTLSGHTGNIVRWEFTTNNGGTWTSIANNTTAQNYTNLTTTTWYRAVVQSGVCSALTSGIAVITVDPATAGGVVSGDASVCSGSASGILILNGQAGSVQKWQYSIDGGTSWTDIANVSISQSYSGLTVTTLYRAVVQSGVCGVVNSSPATITVSPVSIGGSVTSNATVCSGSNSGTLTLSGHTGSVVNWEYSTDGGSSWTSTSNTTTSQIYTNLTLTTRYRAVVKSGACSQVTSGEAIITVNNTVAGSVNSNANVCSGSNSGTLVLTGNVGSVINWEFSTDGGGTWTPIANTSTSQAYLNLTTTTMYRALVQSGSCPSATSSSATITVTPGSAGGTVTSNATVCSGSNTGNLTLAGYTGTINNWEYSTDGGTSWTAISNTLASQSYNNLTSTTRYRAIVQSGACPSVPSVEAIITVNPVSAGGTLSSNATVCSGSNSGTINLAGQTGLINKWEFSIDGGTSWTNIANTTISETYTNLTATTVYRAEVQSGVCAAVTSSTVTITVDPVSVGGTLSSDATVCSGSNSGTLSLAGNIGSVIRWEYSADGIIWAIIPNTSSTLNYINLTSTTLYRAVVQSGICSIANSSVVTITVDPATVGGTVSNNATVCSSSNTGTLNLSGNVGSVLRWEYSTDNGSSWLPIANTTASYTYNNIPVTTWFRAVVQSGSCSLVPSSTAIITVDPATVAGSVTSSSTVCSGSNSGTLILSGQTGSVNYWEYSIDGGTIWTSIATSSTMYTYNNLTTNTIYRANVQSGTCSASASASAIITVDSATVAGVVNSSVSVCSGSSSGTLILSGKTGNVIRWEESTNNGGTWTPIVNSSTTHNYSNITVTTWYRAVVQSGVCNQLSSTIAVITVDPATVGGIVSSNATVCSGSNNGTLLLSGNTGSVQKWQSSVDGGATWTDITNIASNQNYSNLVVTTMYHAIVQSGVCSSLASSDVTITVDPVSVGGIVSANDTVCSGSNSGSLTLSGNTGNVVNWEYSTDGGATWTATSNNTSTQNYSNLTVTTRYRAKVQSGNCPAVASADAEIKVNESFGGTTAGATTVCSGTNSGNVTLSGQTGNVTGWEFSTDGGTTWTAIANTTSLVSYSNLTNTTIYHAIVQNGTCPQAISTDVTITVAPTTASGNIIGSTTVCDGNNSGSLSLVGYSGNILNWEYSIDGGTTWTSIANTTSTENYTNLTTTTYYHALIQVGSCPASASSSAIINVSAPISANAGNDTTITFGSSIQLNGTGTGTFFSWFPGSGLSNPNIPGPVAMPQQTTVYVLTVSNNVCSDVDSVTVTVAPDTSLIIANLLTPNGDGFNDTWTIDNVENIGSVQVSVFNRYGKLLYESSDYKNDWNGTHQGSTLPDGTYYYLIKLNSGKIYKGGVNILSDN